MFDFRIITDIINKSIEDEHELALVLTSQSAVHLRVNELKNYNITNGLLYCGSWIVDINCIVAVNDLTAESEALHEHGPFSIVK